MHNCFQLVSHNNMLTENVRVSLKPIRECLIQRNILETTNPSDKLREEHSPELNWRWKLLTQRVKTCLTDAGKILHSFMLTTFRNVLEHGKESVYLRISRSPKWGLLICCIQVVFLHTERYIIYFHTFNASFYIYMHIYLYMYIIHAFSILISLHNK